MSLSQLEKHIKTINRLSTEIRMLDKMIERSIMARTLYDITAYMPTEEPQWRPTGLKCDCGAELWQDEASMHKIYCEWWGGDKDCNHKVSEGIAHA